MALADDQDVTMHMQRFMDIGEEPRRMLPPILGFEKMPLVSLEEATKQLVSLMPDLEHHVSVAKSNCKMPIADGLSIDESASIRLYTMEWKPKEKCLYVVLNKTLRSEDRQELKPWFLYLRLIIGSLSKIPSTSRHVLRGVKLNLSPQHIKGQTLVWWAFTSCTDSVEMLNNKAMFGQTGDRTLFQIDCYSGKDIRQHSAYSMESEILLLPATQLQTVGYFDTGSGMHIIQLKETEPKFPLMNKIPGANENLPVSSHPVNSRPIIEPPECELLPVPITEQPKSTLLPVPTTGQRKFTSLDEIRHANCGNVDLENRMAGYRVGSPINLNKQKLTDSDMQIVIREAIVTKKCTRLCLQNNDITVAGMSMIAEAMHKTTTLEELDLGHNHLTDTDLYPLARELSANETEHVVQWKCCGIVKMKDIDKAPVKVLNLSNNNIGDEGVRHLVEVIKRKRTLTALHLNGNQISDEGVKLLASALCRPGTNLQKLYLHNNKRITDLSVDVLISMLKGNQSLNTLWLIECTLTSGGRQKIFQEADASKQNFYLNIERC
ncbi:unnamed protein product [Rotaria socialis]|uniref:NAD(P)(+)--arginine ADP-ribosyltransferase n=1 Tax=Rotaria socialis TaxID=392032 RepID=A0A820Y2R6_9BILA|nr:unnamed protein product [Rotaria socialis]CAF3727249.1 unnamed protein product [Rotaria socialis]CAF4543481.1 unnamed protein product [Rotaria socialis]CAF4612042.1 unnamed protein product [Rotaria socialis]